MQSCTRQRPITRRRGFTMIEVAVAIIVLAVGIVAVQSLVASTSRVTAVSNELQTATMLGNAMQERCLGLDRAPLLALNGKSYSPPLDSQAIPLKELSDFTQRVAVTYVTARAVNTDSPTATDLLRVAVTVSHHGRDVLTSSRLIATTKQE